MSGAALDLATEVSDAHATSTLAAADRIFVSFSSGGLAFASKGQPGALVRVEADMHPGRQQISLTGAMPRPWAVQVTGSDDLGSRLAELRSGSRRLRWQPEEVGVFAAAAIWNYLTLPLLLRQAESVHRLPDHAGVRRLRVTLPPTLAGHSRVQTVHVGDDSLIFRHDYTANAFGVWARAAQMITGYENFDGVPIGTSRIVTPRFGRPLPAPRLVWIRLHSIRIA